MPPYRSRGRYGRGGVYQAPYSPYRQSLAGSRTRRAYAMARTRRRGVGTFRAGLRRTHLEAQSYLNRKLGRQKFTQGKRGKGMITRSSRSRGTGLGLSGRANVRYVTESLVSTNVNFTSAPYIWPADTICGSTVHVAKLRVNVQPFPTESTLDAACKFSLSGVSDQVNFHGFNFGWVMQTHPDIVEQMKNYATFRVAAMRVEVTILPSENDENTWGSTTTNMGTFRIECAWDRFDVSGLNSTTSDTFGANVARKFGPSLEIMRRLPHYKQKDFRPGGFPAEGGIGLFGDGVTAWVLFNKKFPQPSRTSRTIVTGATDAVNPGEWDSRAVHSTLYNNAYEVMQDSTLRAGALLVYAHRINDRMSIALDTLALNKHQLRFKTFYDIELKDPVEGIGHIRPDPA